jgi:hypothetical protein
MLYKIQTKKSLSNVINYCYRNYELQFVPYFASGRVPYKNIPGEVTSLGAATS